MTPNPFLAQYWDWADPDMDPNDPLYEINHSHGVAGTYSPFAAYRGGLGGHRGPRRYSPGEYSGALGMGFRLANPRVQDRWGDVPFRNLNRKRDF
jgi:hypothetical protein